MIPERYFKSWQIIETEGHKNIIHDFKKATK